ncbi:Carboxymuconolactone decarboxylase family protein [compost metagenome]|jgi:alkylhydroperoxidase/carboxymuconolactone decarboxylase family protein YurZ|uniref:carboxymuconolactone decarboxylase family protein n=1 Tax=Pseudomonas TaxID=286 RepID=UPI000FBD530E|nr:MULTISPECIES: carboxymuconolactone decarboxylase family protein [Pseudomonas]MBT9236641.1 carboxymuconolactone decarboxylase family protein [Pseudomonas sp. MG-2]MCM8911687.1 carboxymuconolactone decarboxylase family protein [Pseudomonas inefficax]WNN39498.1 carboxymuconolactone decarboxylase family protein [Pseudomonas inefficax]
MNNTAGRVLSKWINAGIATTFMIGLGATEMASSDPIGTRNVMSHPISSQSNSKSLSEQQQAVVVVAALAAIGDLPRLNTALDQALDLKLTVSELREVLVQLYAYAGFPRSLNALTELMQVLESRKQRGIFDDPGREPSRPILQGDALLAAGTANQTKLSGSPVEGPLFDFAPIANQYLRTHLFGDIFERDILDWKTRELATVGMLSALAGVEPQLQAHMRISINTGVTIPQLRHLCQTLSDSVDTQAGDRAANALEKHVASTAEG